MTTNRGYADRAGDLVLHHYWMSPYAEKIRCIFGFKRLPWRSVLIPIVMPKPDLLALTGGYRKIAMLRDGVAMMDRTGAALVRPSYLGMLAAADVMEGDRPSGLARFDEALREMERTGERLHEAALLVAKGQLLADAGDRSKVSRAAANAAEACLRHALAVAHAQGARLLELRAAVALASHCRARGRPAEARELLTSAHAWFATRRPGAPEIVAARSLLAELEA